MKNLRIGIIGAGNIGSAHLRNIAEGKVDGMLLSAVCDNDPQRLEWVKNQYPDCIVFDSYKALVESGSVDAVIVSVPHRMHGEIAEYALKNGLDVLVEKPIDISVSVANRLIDTANKSSRVFGIMLNQRTNSLFKKAREIVKSGQLGCIKRSVWIITNWYRTQSYYDSGNWRATWAGEGGGVLLNQAVHNIDIWQWICGMPKSITAFCAEGRFHNIEVEDDVTILAEFEGGGTGTFITSTGEYPGTNRLEISGDLGKLVIENGVLKWWQLDRSEREVCFEDSNSFTHIEHKYHEFAETNSGGHTEILSNFANAVLKNEPLIALGEDGICSLEILNAAYLSQWENNIKIQIPFDNEKYDRILKSKMENSCYINKKRCEIRNNEYSDRWQVRWQI